MNSEIIEERVRQLMKINNMKEIELAKNELIISIFTMKTKRKRRILIE